MAEKRVTIRDIARLTNVSSATVSLVINHKPGVGAATRERVLSVARALNFTPNMLARSLVTQRTNSIAMMITTMQNSVFTDIAAGVHQVLQKRGYLLSIMPTNADEAVEANAMESIRARGFDGVITSATLLNNENSKKLADAGLPVVRVLRRSLNRDDMDYVGIDNLQGAYLAIEHLIRMGHQRIGLIKGPANTSTGVERLEGALRAFKDYGLIVSDDLIQQGDYLRKSGYDATLRLIAPGAARRPTAIFAANDDMAFGAMDALIDHGLRIPADMALIGAGNVEATSFRTVRMTTVSQQNTDMGYLAAKRIVDRIEKRRGFKKKFQIELKPELIVRESCGFHLTRGYAVAKTKQQGL